MDLPLLSCDELVARCDVGGGHFSVDEPPLLLVDLTTGSSGRGARGDALTARFVDQVMVWPYVVIGVGPSATHRSPIGTAVDAVFEPDDVTLGAVIDTVTRVPIAAVTLVTLLRMSAGLEPLAGLVAESAAYSTLQSGPEFAAWCQSRPVASDPPVETGDAVRIECHADDLHIVMHRPHVHNAINRQLRLELHDAFRIAALHPERPVVFRGDGPSFSSGGDLTEFGTFTDPATAHIVRLHAHPAAAMLALPHERTSAHVHGACLGGGLELAAFAGRIIAHPESSFGLPELGLGLLPGAGGTVSVPRRIGRQGTARLALSLERLDAATAFARGLIDEISDG